MPKGAAVPFSEDEIAELQRLHAEGKGRNEIARALGRSLRGVSIHAGRLGLTFDRSMTEAATRARKADLEERRVILAEALQADAEQLTEQLWQPSVVFNIGGKDNEYTEHELPEPPADAKKALMSAAALAIDKSLKLCPPDTDMEGLAAVDAWLRGMMPSSE
ncbi:helix-turn-helix domain-containing protein [Streptomyces longwoodensis]|uniref:helix-turn-helix domain-containing protein n=1 Tax=Streptomyces longwoodensis TaxID=68231 RepID=UPI0037A3E5B3